MSYSQALEKSWSQIAHLTGEPKFSIRLMADEYEIDVNKRSVLSLSCNLPAKEHISIILLHYLIQKLKLKILPKPAGEWMDFKQIQGAETYYPAFKKRVIDTLLRKFGRRPEALLDLAERFAAKKVQIGDIGIVIEILENVPLLITFWKADEEFGPEANVLFDKSILKIFCTEDIIVLAELVAHLL